MPLNLFDPRTMLSVIERNPQVKTFLKDTFFGRVETSNTEYIDVDFTKGNRELAPFVHDKIAQTTTENQGYVTKQFKPALVTADRVTTAGDILKRTAGELPYNSISPEERAAQKIARDFLQIDEMITRREEWMCAQTLFTGKIPVIGKGVNYEIDFNFTNKDVKSGTDLWSDAKAKPISQIEEMAKQVQKTGFVNPDICILGQNAASEFVNNASVQKILDTEHMNLATIEPRQLPNGATYIGTIPKLGLSIYQYNEWYLDNFTDPKNPQVKSLIPDDYCGIFSSQMQGFMGYGVNAIIDNASKEFVSIEGTRCPDSWIQKKPAAKYIQLMSRPLSCPVEVDAWFISKVV